MDRFERVNRREGWGCPQTDSAKRGKRTAQRTLELEGRQERETILDERTDPNLFALGPDGRIRGKQTTPTSPKAQLRNARVRDMRPRQPLPQPPPPSSRSHRARADSAPDLSFDDQISYAIALSFSLNEQWQNPSRGSARRSSTGANLPMDETANPNFFSFGLDGIVRPKTLPEADSSPSFDEEATRAGVTWLHVPQTRPPPSVPLARRMSRPLPSTDSPQRHAISPQTHQSQVQSLSPQRPPQQPLAQDLVAPSCHLDPSRRAISELLASTKAAAITANARPIPRFDPRQLSYENLLLLDQTPLSAAERSRKGLSPQQLLTLHSIKIHAPPSLCSAPPQCSICQDEFRHGDAGVCLPRCRHLFHGHCLGPWLADHAVCPNCRSLVVC
jgi:hypothetical protein